MFGFLLHWRQPQAGKKMEMIAIERRTQGTTFGSWKPRDGFLEGGSGGASGEGGLCSKLEARGGKRKILRTSCGPSAKKITRKGRAGSLEPLVRLIHRRQLSIAISKGIATGKVDEPSVLESSVHLGRARTPSLAS